MTDTAKVSDPLPVKRLALAPMVGDAKLIPDLPKPWHPSDPLPEPAAPIPSVHTVPTLAMTLQQVAKACGVAPRTVYRWHERGLLRALPCTRKLIFPIKEVEAFLAAQVDQPAP